MTDELTEVSLVERWEAAVADADPDAMRACLATDVRFFSPAVHRPYEGQDATMLVLTNVMTVFEDFTYTDVLDCGDRLGLVFTARVGDRDVEGWDYLKLDDDGLIREFTVMLRPLSGLTAVLERMSALMAAAD